MFYLFTPTDPSYQGILCFSELVVRETFLASNPLLYLDLFRFL